MSEARSVGWRCSWTGERPSDSDDAAESPVTAEGPPKQLRAPGPVRRAVRSARPGGPRSAEQSCGRSMGTGARARSGVPSSWPTCSSRRLRTRLPPSYSSALPLSRLLLSSRRNSRSLAHCLVGPAHGTRSVRRVCADADVISGRARRRPAARKNSGMMNRELHRAPRGPHRSPGRKRAVSLELAVGRLTRGDAMPLPPRSPSSIDDETMHPHARPL
jgi:hypothetical protein